MSDTPLTDTELWIAFKNKDKEAFHNLFKLYYSELFLYGYKLVNEKSIVEDAIQELFEELWLSKSAADVKIVKAYLYKSLRNMLLRKVKSSKLTVLASNQLPLEFGFHLSKETLIINAQESEERKAQIIDSMGKLTDRQREITYLRFYREFSYEEISEMMGISYQASRNLLSQSLKTLRTLLDR